LKTSFAPDMDLNMLLWPIPPSIMNAT